MQNAEKTKQSVWPVVWRLFDTAGRQRSWFVAALVVDLLMAALLILTNHFNRRFFEAVSAGDARAFWMFAGLSVGLSVLNIPFGYIKTSGMGRFSERTLAHLRGQIAAHSAALPMGELEARHSGDLLSVLNADLGKLKTLLANNLIDLVGQTVRGLAAFAYILSINWVLTLVTTILTPLIFILISRLTQPISERSEELQEEIGQVNSTAQDGLAGAMVVKAFNLTGLMDERFHAANQKALKKGLNIARLKSIVEGVTLPMAMAPFIIAVGLGGYLIIHQQISFGSLFVFISLLNFVINPLAGLPSVIASISESAGAARRVFALIDQPTERTSGLTTLPDPSPAALTFERVSFAYADGAPVLKDVSFTIPAGQTAAIVGPSGGGKSTLLKLILGYYPPSQGRAALFGRDLHDWQPAAARERMAFVAQDTYLFPVSLGDNIRLGKPGASQAEVEQAAKLANIHDFIHSLPDGYASAAGEWGARLSGGQKQRIALARAILKDAPVLLLDEPTSALDTESEALVQQALDRFTQGRTTLVIAHRLSTIKNADRVLVLDDGAIVEQGTHDELIARGGVYLDLYRRQYAPEVTEAAAQAAAEQVGQPGGAS